MGRFKSSPKKVWRTLDEHFILRSSDGIGESRKWKIKKVSEFTVGLECRTVQGKGKTFIHVDTGTGLHGFQIPREKRWRAMRFWSEGTDLFKSGNPPHIQITCHPKRERKTDGLKAHITEIEFRLIKFINAVKPNV